MPRPLDGAAGERMELAAYYADFEENFARAREFWKLERGQEFAEPGDASWEAFDRGDWDEAMRLLEARRPDLVKYHEETAAAGTSTRRIRIVSLPLTPYMQWELNLLKVRDETGGPIRVLLDSQVAGLEDQGPLPEIYTMDDAVMYEAVYDANGVLECALRYTDPELVGRCRGFISGLYERGEPIAGFFRREVAPLPPPPPRGAGHPAGLPAAGGPSGSHPLLGAPGCQRPPMTARPRRARRATRSAAAASRATSSRRASSPAAYTSTVRRTVPGARASCRGSFPPT